MNDSLWEREYLNFIPTAIYPVLRNVKHLLRNSANLLTKSLFSHVINQIILSKLFKQAKFGIVSLM